MLDSFHKGVMLKNSMYYEKMGAVIRGAILEDRKPILTEAQVEKLKTVGNVVLAIVASAAVVSLAFTVPKALVALDIFTKKRFPHQKFSKRERDRKISDVFYYLKRSGYVRMWPTGKDFKVLLTKLGRKRLKELDFDTLAIKPPKSWDGKWWQVAADIPTKKYKSAADSLRRKSKDLGFFPLQRTLWFYPYDPRVEVEYIANRFNIGRFVTVMEVSRLDRDDEKRMRLYFRKQKVL